MTGSNLRSVSLVRVILAVLCLVFMLAPELRAQLYTGTVTGLISDASGAVVPGAQVQLTDEERGYAFNVITDTSGNYLFRSVPPGTYRIEVHATGFESETRSGIVVEVNHNVTVDLALRVGATNQTLQVTGRAPLLDTQDAVTGQVVNRRYIEDLPLVGRSLSDLTFLTPGVTEVDTFCPADYTLPGPTTSGCAANNIISNGSRNATADFLLDGVSTSYANHIIRYPAYEPSLESVQEFNVQESNFTAATGFSGGTVVNIVTLSGTNQFHGEFYDFLRNQKFDANYFFNNAAGVPLPPLQLNDFGGTVGGPVLIPHIYDGHNKTFFFFDYDGIRENGTVAGTSGVPDAAERVGDFSELCNEAGGSFNTSGMCSASGGQLWDPYTGVYNANLGGPVRSAFIPFNNLMTYQSPGNPILTGTGFQLPATPGNLIDPISAKFIQYMPLPNYNVGTNAYNPYTNWVGSPANDFLVGNYDIKVDQAFGNNDHLSVKYSRGSDTEPPVVCYGKTDPADPCSVGTSLATVHLVAVNYAHTFSPALLLTVSLGITRGLTWNQTIGDEPQFKGISPSATLGMPTYMDRSGFNELPDVYWSGYSVPANQFGGVTGQLGTQSYCCGHYTYGTNELAPALAWVKRSHSLQFGFQGIMRQFNQGLPSCPAGCFNLDPSGTSEYPTSGGGDSIASFLTGVGGPSGYGSYDVQNPTATESFQYGLFAQDNWKVSKKLTLNLGFRDEINIPETARHNHMNELSLSAVSPLQVPSLGTLHGGEIFMTPANRSPYFANYHNLAPRIAFAYSPRNNWVVRGGYGIFYYTGNSQTSGISFPGFQGYDQVTPWLTSYQNDGAVPWGRFSSPWPITGPSFPVGNSLGLLNEVGLGINAPIPAIDSPTPYEQSWTLDIQHEFPSNILLDVGYIGNKGTHLQMGQNINYDILGPAVEKDNAAQIAALETYIPNPFYGIITNSLSALSGTTVPAYQLQLPFPQFTSFAGDVAPWANSDYNSLQVKLEKRLSHGLQFLVTYVWSKSIDDNSSMGGGQGSFSSLQDPNNIELERGLSTFDIPNVFQFTYVYALPFGRGKALFGKANPVLNALIGGWNTSGTWRFNSGRPEALMLEESTSLPTYGAQRPDLIGNLTCTTGSWATRLNDYFTNPQVVTTPPAFAIGDAPRTDGSCRQPGAANANLSLFKDFSLSKLREGSRLEMRLETYNAFNHPQFGGPNTTLNSGSFGVITTQANVPRQVQLVLKFYW